MTHFHPSDHDYPPASDTHIRVASGTYVDLADPDPETIFVEDIAHGLAHVCRFGGHVATFYSVAEHSLNVAAQLDRMFGDPYLTMQGLFHDATEAFMGDIVRPLKHSPVMDGYREAESNLERAIALRFGLAVPAAVEVKAADNEILIWEMAMIRDAPWRTPTPPATVREAFTNEYKRLAALCKGRHPARKRNLDALEQRLIEQLPALADGSVVSLSLFERRHNIDPAIAEAVFDLATMHGHLNHHNGLWTKA